VPNFPTQFAENIYQSVSFSISIPIYSQHNTRTNEQIQLIQTENAKLERDKIIWEMSSTILQLQIDIKNAKSELESSIYVLNLTKLDFDQAENKYQAGQINYAELLTKQDQLFTAQSNVVQAKYNYYFKMKILHLYHEQ
jgi:outer membrane protein